VRSVVLSNTVLVVSSRTERNAEVVVRDELHDLLELTPCLPRLRRLDELLSGLEYGEDNFDDDDMEFDNFDDGVEHLTQTRVSPPANIDIHVNNPRS
jgi:sister chromatid cohesion protein DCC1